MRLATAIGLGITMLAATARAQETKTDANGIVGNYEIVSGENSGKPVPEERIKGSTVRITAETIVVVDKDEKEVYVTKYNANTTAKPYKITMVETGGPRGRKGEKAVGIIEPDADGQTVRLAYAYEGGIVPTDFKTKDGGKQLSFVLKRKEAK